MIAFIIFALLSINLASAQSCLKYTGQAVQWWIVLKVPPKIGKTGFGYYDSTMKTGRFAYESIKVDVGATALTKTLQLINSQNLEHVAWNDEKPSGEVNSTCAHSKGLIAYSTQNAKGFFLQHSIPKYPAFANQKVNVTIGDSQNYYGQHLSCFSLTLKDLDDIASHLVISWPWVYESKVVGVSTNQNIYKLSRSSFPQSSNQFQKYDLRSALGYTLKTIFKNDHINGSIFEDGLTSYLNVNPLVAETWGRPIQKSWCSKGFQVLNVVDINLAGITWNEQDDHSKWVLAGSSYTCWGDMNRMTSQWKRGGAFYCLNEPTLVTALKAVIVSTDKC